MGSNDQKIVHREGIIREAWRKVKDWVVSKAVYTLTNKTDRVARQDCCDVYVQFHHLYYCHRFQKHSLRLCHKQVLFQGASLLTWEQFAAAHNDLVGVLPEEERKDVER